MKHLSKLLVVVLAAALMLTACSVAGTPATSSASTQSVSASGTSAVDTSSTAAASKSAKSTFKIGVSTQGWSNEFIKNMVNELNRIDKERDDIQLVIVDSGDTVEKQLNDVDNLISQGIDGLILDADSAEGCDPIVQTCKSKNIPLVELVALTNDTGYSTFVGTDVKASGRMAGEAIVSLLNGKGNILVIEGAMGHSGQINRAAGLQQALKDQTNIKILDKQSGEWSKDKAMSLTENWLTKYKNIDLIVAHNDSMGLGAMNACKAAGRTNIKLIGIDGDAEALQGVIDGTYTESILDNVEVESQKAVEEMVSILQGNKPKGKIIVDYVPITDKATAEKYLKARGKG